MAEFSKKPTESQERLKGTCWPSLRSNVVSILEHWKRDARGTLTLLILQLGDATQGPLFNFRECLHRYLIHGPAQFCVPLINPLFYVPLVKYHHEFLLWQDSWSLSSLLQCMNVPQIYKLPGVKDNVSLFSPQPAHCLAPSE